MSLRCPVCDSVSAFSIICTLDVEFDEDERLNEDLNDRFISINDSAKCCCKMCGNTGNVSEFRKYRKEV